MTKAPRQRSRTRTGATRGALLAFGLWLAGASGPLAETIQSARFTRPTTHYPHGVLGDDIEYSGMTITRSQSGPYRIEFPPGGRVFEDIEPRLWDVTGDGAPEIVVVETDPSVGAQLAIYGLTGDTVAKIAATPHIGRPHRWLAPLGAADLDGDGHIELAYIDRPHLAKTLRIWRFRDGRLTHVADAPGLTNHRIGQDFISGGIRQCGARPEIITADGRWSRIMATTLSSGKLTSRDIGPFTGSPTGSNSLTAALTCD